MPRTFFFSNKHILLYLTLIYFSFLGFAQGDLSLNIKF